MPDTLRFENISKNYGNVTALNNVSLQIKRGEFFSLLGPSGCGKTTLLRILAGFEKPDSGRVMLDGQDITDLPPNERPVNTVFQNYALFPHLSIWENIAFGLRVRGCSEREIRKEVERMLQLIQMDDHGHKKPHQISGGQKQRVAIARALVNKPRVLLLDEPLAALDLKLRQKMLFELELIHGEVGITFVFVTHDQEEAMAVSDRIAVLNHAKLEQVGKPVELYEAPVSSFVAAFIGDTNFLDGTVAEKISEDYSRLFLDHFPDLLCYNDKKLSVGDLVHLSVRPEKIHIQKEKPEPKTNINLLSGIVEDVVYKGDRTLYWVAVDGHLISVIKQHRRFHLEETQITWNDHVWLWWHADDGYMLERWRAEDGMMTQSPSDALESIDDLQVEEADV